MKKAIILAVAALAMGGQAMAANFTEGDFVRTFYNESNTYMWDLGAAPAAGTATTAAFTGAAQTGNLTFWSYNKTSHNGYFSWDSSTFDPAMFADYNDGSSMNVVAPLVYSHNQTGNYYSETSIGTLGYYDRGLAGFNTFFTDVGRHQAGFNGTAGQAATQYLFQFNYNPATFEITLLGNQPWGSVQTTFANGDFQSTVTQNAAPVPIPGAVVLLGSGLAGLLGIRRKVS